MDLKNIVTEVVVDAVGEDCLKIVFYLRGQHDISEFVIADDTETEIHVVRNILYRLNSQHLVTYRRKKDKEKGWYISYWTFNEARVPELRETLKLKRLERFKNRLKDEEENKGNYYISPDGATRMTFDEAVEHDFQCPETGDMLLQHDNTKTINRLREMVASLEKEIIKDKVVNEKIATRELKLLQVPDEPPKKKVVKKKKVKKKKKVVKKKVVKKEPVKKVVKKVVEKKPVKKKVVKKAKKVTKKRKK